MTYYGRWTYKYEIASAQGRGGGDHHSRDRTGGLSVRRRAAAATRRSSSTSSRPTPRSACRSRAGSVSRRRRSCCSAAGQNFDSLKAAAARKDFKPVALQRQGDVRRQDRRAQDSVAQRRRQARGHRQEGRVRRLHGALGSPRQGHDAQGRPDLQRRDGQRVSGSSALLEIAKAFTKLPTPPRRSILFLSVTAEEKGLVGAKYYATHPLYPLNKTVANINIDGINQWGKTSDFTVIGLGQLDARRRARRRAQGDNRTVRPDAEPEKGFYYRSDHFEFAKAGRAGARHRRRHRLHRQAGGLRHAEARRVHEQRLPQAVSDEVKPDWDLSGARAGHARRCSRSAYAWRRRRACRSGSRAPSSRRKRDSMMAARSDAPKSVELKKP